MNMSPAAAARHYAEVAARILHPENIQNAERRGDLHLVLLQAQTNALTAIALTVTQTPEPRTVKL